MVSVTPSPEVQTHLLMGVPFPDDDSLKYMVLSHTPSVKENKGTGKGLTTTDRYFVLEQLCISVDSRLTV